MPNKKLSGSLANYVASVDLVEQYTNIDFFSQLEDSLEDKLEAINGTTSWNFSV